MMLLSIEEHEPYLFEVPSSSVLNEQDESLQNAQKMLSTPSGGQTTDNIINAESSELLIKLNAIKEKPLKSSRGTKPSTDKNNHSSNIESTYDRRRQKK